MESPNLEFEYGDTDALTAELSGKAGQPRCQTGRVPIQGLSPSKCVSFVF